MSHELARKADGKYAMTYVGEKPWHRLGQKATGNESLEEFMKLAGCDFTVRMDKIYVPVQRLDETAQEITDYVTVPGFRGIVREDTNETLDVVTDRYKPVGNTAFFSTAKEFLKEASVKLDTAGVLRRGRHTWLLCKLDESFTVAGGRDQTDAYLLLSNHFLAGFASSMMLTNVRVVCNNTITMALGGRGRRWTHNHIEDFNADKAKAALGIGKEGFKQYAEQAEFLASKRMKNDDEYVAYVKRVYDLRDPSDEDTEKTEKRAANQRVIDRMKTVLEHQPGVQLANGTWWTAFNAVTFDNDHLIGRSESVRLASAWYGVGAQRKARALTLALDYAKAT